MALRVNHWGWGGLISVDPSCISTEITSSRSGSACGPTFTSSVPLGVALRQHVFRSIGSLLSCVAVLIGVGACGQPSAEPVASLPSVSATPTVYPVPEDCPPPKELGKAWVEDPDWFTAVDAKLIDTEVKTPLPKNGCAYLFGEEGTATSSNAKYKHIMVWYFNLNRPGTASTSDMISWAKSAGGTPLTGTDPVSNAKTTDTSGEDFDLPETFTGWTGSKLVQVNGQGSSFGWDQSILPAYTQGAQAKIEFAINAEKAAAMLKATGSAGTTADPTKSLSQGLAASFSAGVVATDDQGYTVQLKVQGKLEPFIKNVTEAPPGQLHAVSTSTVSGSVTNTTSGRQTKTPSGSVIALYPLESAACTNYNGISVKDADWQDSSYCAINLGQVAGATLAPNASQAFPEVSVPQKLGTFPETGTAIEKLNAPASFYFSFGGKGRGLTGVDWRGDKGCQAQSQSGGGSWYVVMDGWPDLICG